MRVVRRGPSRGHADHGWLESYHTFSFAGYYDPAQLGFGSLRVINEDWVQPGQGFPMHGHRDMEIVTYVLSGELEHRDSMGHGAVLRPGELQHMTAGSGILHSEFNPSPSEPVHLYQIWLHPAQRGLKPSYDQKAFPAEGRRNQWQLVASPDGRAGSLAIQQDAELLLAELQPGMRLERPIPSGRKAWLQVLRGELHADGETLRAGDALALTDEPHLALAAAESASPAEVLLFDMGGSSVQ